ncbi:MAG: ABC transporter permease [Ruminococcaceae bacterium]|nr:ABC transporter permease [Oscillospiraceae bacterium]
MKKGNSAIDPAQVRRRSQLAEIWRNFRKNKGAMIGLILIIIIITIGATVSFWIDYDKIVAMNIRERLQPPSAEHWFGTDEMGRDLFWRVLYGTRYSIAVGFVAVMVSLAIGIPVGAVAGYFGGKIENLIMRGADIFAAVPGVLMAMVIVAILGANVFNLMLAIGIAAVPGFIRTTRAAVLTVKNEEYIEAIRALGKSEPYIIARHVLPNCLSPIIVRVTLRIAGAIISASSLSFLGLGIEAPLPEWGALLNGGNKFVMTHPYLTIFPGLAIMITVLAFNLVGDGLRDAMDPKLKR